MASAPRIVFLHGLESGPGGSKHRFLKEHYGEQVVCQGMQVSMFHPFKANSLLRHCFAHCLTTLPWNVAPWSVRASLEGSLATQREELAAAQLSGGVLVASSWGGAVATLALARGEWLGPAVLLAPAYGRAGRWAAGSGEGFSPEEVYAAINARLEAVGEKRAAQLRQQIIIVHGTCDDTVPLEDSRAMARATGVQLLEIEGGDHRLNNAVLSGDQPLLKTLIKQVTSYAEQ